MIKYFLFVNRNIVAESTDESEIARLATKVACEQYDAGSDANVIVYVDKTGESGKFMIHSEYTI